MISFNKKSLKKINLIVLSVLLFTLTFANFSIQAQETREVEHAMGTTEISGTPERIVVLYQGQPIHYWLLIKNQLVQLSPGSKSPGINIFEMIWKGLLI